MEVDSHMPQLAIKDSLRPPFEACKTAKCPNSAKLSVENCHCSVESTAACRCLCGRRDQSYDAQKLERCSTVGHCLKA